MLRKPAQESIRGLTSFWGDPVVVSLDHPVDEYRQLVYRKHDWLAVLSECVEDLVTAALPVSGVHSCAQLKGQLGNSNFVYVVAYVSQAIGKAGRDAVPGAPE